MDEEIARLQKERQEEMAGERGDAGMGGGAGKMFDQDLYSSGDKFAGFAQEIGDEMEDDEEERGGGGGTHPATAIAAAQRKAMMEAAEAADGGGADVMEQYREERGSGVRGVAPPSR